ncbi:MAG: hypothetical protein K5873_08450 [Treponema sp.]|nr:hypothetical protein [Treponema sp.]
MQAFRTNAAALVSLALCSGLFVSCDAGEDNSDSVRSYEEAAKKEREAEEQVKLESIGIYISGSNNGGGKIIYGDGNTKDAIPRHYSDSKKTHAVIYFAALPNEGYRFSFVGLTVTTEPATTDFQYELYTEKTNYFKVTVPIETTLVKIDASNAFTPVQP